MVNSLFNKKSSDAENNKENELSLTTLYFLEKIKGNLNLEELEKGALKYVEALDHSAATPPDLYFIAKLAIQTEIENEKKKRRIFKISINYFSLYDYANI